MEVVVVVVVFVVFVVFVFGGAIVSYPMLSKDCFEPRTRGCVFTASQSALH